MRDLPELGPVPPSALAEIVAQGRPVVLRGQVTRWPAVAAARETRIAPYLRSMASDRAAPCVVGVPAIGRRFFYRPDMAGMNFGRRDVPLAVLLDELTVQQDMAAPLALAMQSAPTDLVLPGFAEAHPLDLLPRSVRPRLWIGNRVDVATHYDSNDNIACVIAGRRRFVLFPPDQAPNLYMGPLELTPAGTPVSLPDPFDPDLDRYPRFAEALAVAEAAELAPGDAIYIPYLWWHGVRSLDPLSALINYWWSDQAEQLLPADALLHAIAAMRALPDRKRAAWRALFDHLAFDDAAGAHLPEAARGVTGRLPDRARIEIARHLAGKLGGVR